MKCCMACILSWMIFGISFPKNELLANGEFLRWGVTLLVGAFFSWIAYCVGDWLDRKGWFA